MFLGVNKNHSEVLSLSSILALPGVGSFELGLAWVAALLTTAETQQTEGISAVVDQGTGRHERRQRGRDLKSSRSGQRTIGDT